jgi:hypothetical protein
MERGSSNNQETAGLIGQKVTWSLIADFLLATKTESS